MGNTEHRVRCSDCNRFVKWRDPGSGWEACGEFGEETRYICKACVAKPGSKLQASNGSTDPRWCGIYQSIAAT